MSVNSRYTNAGREMAVPSRHGHHRYHSHHHGRERDEECISYSSSSEDELGMAGHDEEEDTRRLLRARSGEHYPAPHVSAAPVSVYPQLATLDGRTDYQGPPSVSVAAGNGGQQTQYGSVSSSLPSHARSKTRWKRYRLPFLILLVFDCGLVIFLSIISYDSKVGREKGREGRGRETERERERERERWREGRGREREREKEGEVC